MIIRRLVRHQFRPADYEQLVLEAEVTIDTEQTQVSRSMTHLDLAQSVIDELLAEDLARAKRVDVDEQTYVQDWLDE
jgi:hypothetical protein